MKANQRTISQPVEIEGKGLFLGKSAIMRLLPGKADEGIIFVRTDLPEPVRIPVNSATGFSKLRRTAVRSDDVSVETTEHLLSAINGMNINSLIIEIDNLEVPHTDGSAQPFVEALQHAGIVELDAPQKTHTILEPISVVDGDTSIVALPSNTGLTISYTMDYANTPIGVQHFTIHLTPETMAKEIAPARTFCLEEEAKAFMDQGLGSGADYSNTLVVGTDGPIENTLRFENEYVRHKILDLIGDLALVGASLKGHIIANKTGHSTNLKLVKKITHLFTTEKKTTERKDNTFLDVLEIYKILPHRYPFLLLDKVIELEGYKRAVGIKNVTINEPFFQGHFPGQPIMPGVLQIEAMAQLAGALLLRKAENVKKLAVLLSLDNVKLRKTVVPGDQLRIEAEALKVKSRTGEVYTRATVDGQIAVEANMKFMIVDPD